LGHYGDSILGLFKRISGNPLNKRGLPKMCNVGTPILERCVGELLEKSFQ